MATFFVCNDLVFDLFYKFINELTSLILRAHTATPLIVDKVNK